VVGTTAFTVGLLHGPLEAVYDTLMAIPDLIKLVWKVLRSLFTLEIVDDVKQLWDTLKNIDWRQALSNIADEFLAKWDADSTWERWYFRGDLVGYIIATAILTFFTAGAIAEVLAESKFARVIELILNNPAVKQVLENGAVKKIVDKGKGLLEKAQELQEKLKLWKEQRALRKIMPQVLKEVGRIPGTSLPRELTVKVGERVWIIGRNERKLSKEGEAVVAKLVEAARKKGGEEAAQVAAELAANDPKNWIGPAAKHLAEEAKGTPWYSWEWADKKSPWMQFTQVDFPIISLGSGLAEAEKAIVKGAGVVERLGDGVFKVTLKEGEYGWEFMVNTKEDAWRVFHAQILKPK
jgi:hypothetical protein